MSLYIGLPVYISLGIWNSGKTDIVIILLVKIHCRFGYLQFLITYLFTTFVWLLLYYITNCKPNFSCIILHKVINIWKNLKWKLFVVYHIYWNQGYLIFGGKLEVVFKHFILTAGGQWTLQYLHKSINRN